MPSKESFLETSSRSKLSCDDDDNSVPTSRPRLSITDLEQTKSLGISSSGEEDISLYISCVCNSAENITGISLIVCSTCNGIFHANCVGLDEHDISLIQIENSDWFCPKCRDYSSLSLSNKLSSTECHKVSSEGSNESASATNTKDNLVLETGEYYDECEPSVNDSTKVSED